MLSVPDEVSVFFARDPIDKRKSFDSLAAGGFSSIDENPRSGCLLLNRRRGRVKILGWTGTGHFVFYKRLD